jgi:hypothetical protein
MCARSPDYARAASRACFARGTSPLDPRLRAIREGHVICLTLIPYLLRYLLSDLVNCAGLRLPRQRHRTTPQPAPPTHSDYERDARTRTPTPSASPPPHADTPSTPTASQPSCSARCANTSQTPPADVPIYSTQAAHPAAEAVPSRRTIASAPSQTREQSTPSQINIGPLGAPSDDPRVTPSPR